MKRGGGGEVPHLQKVAWQKSKGYLKEMVSLSHNALVFLQLVYLLAEQEEL